MSTERNAVWGKAASAVALSFAVYLVPLDVRSDSVLLGPAIVRFSSSLAQNEHLALASVLAGGALALQAALGVAVYLALSSRLPVKLMCAAFLIALFFIARQLSFAVTLAEAMLSDGAQQSTEFAEGLALKCAASGMAVLQERTQLGHPAASFLAIKKSEEGLEVVEAAGETCDLLRRIAAPGSIDGLPSRAASGALLIPEMSSANWLDAELKSKRLGEDSRGAVLSSSGERVAWTTAGKDSVQDAIFSSEKPQRIALLARGDEQPHYITFTAGPQEVRASSYSVLAVDDSAETITLFGKPDVVLGVDFEGKLRWGPLRMEPSQSGSWQATPRLTAAKDGNWAAVFSDHGRHAAAWSFGAERSSILLPAHTRPFAFDVSPQGRFIAVSLEPLTSAEEVYPFVAIINMDSAAIAAKHFTRVPISGLKFMAADKLAVSDSLPDNPRSIVLDISGLD